MICTHVDDLLFAYTDEGKEAVDAISSAAFRLGRLRKVRFATVVAVFPRMMI